MLCCHVAHYKRYDENPNPKTWPAVAFATKSNNCCAAMWRTIKGAMKNPNPNPNPNPNLPHVHNDIAWLIQHVSAPQRLRRGQSRLIKVFLKINI